jgi:hypothetical protein
MPDGVAVKAGPGTSRAIAVRIEEDPTPLVAITATGLKRLLRDPGFAEQTASLRGVAVVNALSGPQALTLRLLGDAVELEHGAAPEAEVAVGVDLEEAGLEPAVTGEEARPDLCAWLFAVLEPPPLEWREAAGRFWEVARQRSGAPPALLVHEEDSGVRITFGTDAPDPYEIHGSAAALATLFSGQLPLAEAALRGAVRTRGSLLRMSVLTGAGFALMLGEGDE